MKVVIIAGLILSVTYLSHSYGEEDVNSQREHIIVVSVEPSPQVANMREITLKVSYQNHGEEEWKLNNPTNSIHAMFKWRLSRSENAPNWHSLGKMEYVSDATGRTAWIMPSVFSRKPFVITPSNSFDFEYKFFGEVAEERYTIWFEDNKEKLASNKVDIQFNIGEVLKVEEADMATNDKENKTALKVAQDPEEDAPAVKPIEKPEAKKTENRKLVAEESTDDTPAFCCDWRYVAVGVVLLLCLCVVAYLTRRKP